MFLKKKDKKQTEPKKTVKNGKESQINITPMVEDKILGHKKIPTQKEIEKSLKNIYQDESGQIPSMGKLEFKNKSRFKNLLILIIVLFCIFGVSFLGLVFFQTKPKFTNENINLEIKAPFNAISGDNINYQIKISNQENTSLTKVQLDVYFPNGFIVGKTSLPWLTKSDQTNNNQSNIKTWQISDLGPGQILLLDISGQLIADLNSKQIISATLSYVPANFNSEFQKTTTFTSDVNASLVDLAVESPAQTADSENTDLILKISNQSETLTLNIEIDLNFPDEFTLTESQVIRPDNPNLEIQKAAANEASPKIWTIDQLLPKTENQIKLKGKFSVTESKTVELTAQLKLKGTAEDYYLLKEQKIDIEVVKGNLLTNLIISGSNQNQPVNFGDTLNYLLVLQNKSKKALGDLKVRAILDSALLNWSSLNDKNKGLIEDMQILWTKDQIPSLALLLPEEEVEISFQINLNNDQSKKFHPEDYQIKSSFETQINKIDNATAEVVVPSNTVINQINTDLNFIAEVRYFASDNNTVGSGPLPPIIGQKTSYRVYLKLNNSLHEIQNIEAKVKLPDYVNYESQENYSTGSILKNEQQEIVWQISRIPTSVSQADASFEISITPASKDAQKILTLINEINLTATDAQTNGQITKSLQGFTTNLDSDPLGKGKGLVQSE
ncbi:MAG: hypothetical protein NTX00_02650 [Candidatus Parcubacteria bacterium]|nr:hypothetical protein [Candidatus Parcubacteria bacterium]